MRLGDSPKLVAAVVVAALVAGCAAAPAPRPAAEAPEETVLTGRLERAEIEAALPEWVAAQVEARTDPEGRERLARIGAGAEVTVFLGTWCSDSRRELNRFWRALDEIGGEALFTLTYVGVDRAKSSPPELVEGVDLRYVPTFVVRIEGREVGRIVESAPAGIEVELAALLAGEKTGLVTGRDDLAGGG